MNKFDGVANTLFVPLVARINISKKFPEYFMDESLLYSENTTTKNILKSAMKAYKFYKATK